MSCIDIVQNSLVLLTGAGKIKSREWFQPVLLNTSAFFSLGQSDSRYAGHFCITDDRRSELLSACARKELPVPETLRLNSPEWLIHLNRNVRTLYPFDRRLLRLDLRKFDSIKILEPFNKRLAFGIFLIFSFVDLSLLFREQSQLFFAQYPECHTLYFLYTKCSPAAIIAIKQSCTRLSLA